MNAFYLMTLSAMPTTRAFAEALYSIIKEKSLNVLSKVSGDFREI